MASDSTLPRGDRTPLSGAAVHAQRPAGSWRAVLAYWLMAYKRTWRGSVFGRFLSPVLFLLSMGLGLGSLVNSRAGGVGGVPYLQFVVPGILAAQAMWVAVGESTYQVLGAIRWQMTYHAMLATPIAVWQVLLGHLAYVVLQLTGATVVFVGVGAAFGAWESWWVLLAVPVTVLTGLAFAAPIFAFSARQDGDDGFNILFRFIVTPLFLFSGTFFPVDSLPVWLRPVAWLTPLWHGVDADRQLALGTPKALLVAGHVGYLVVVVALAGWVALRSFRHRLVV